MSRGEGKGEGEEVVGLTESEKAVHWFKRAKAIADERDQAVAALAESEERLARVRQWTRDYPLTENPDWGEYIKAQNEVEGLLDEPVAPPLSTSPAKPEPRTCPSCGSHNPATFFATPKTLDDDEPIPMCPDPFHGPVAPDSIPKSQIESLVNSDVWMRVLGTLDGIATGLEDKDEKEARQLASGLRDLADAVHELRTQARDLLVDREEG